jgi:hypothetical protein
MLHSLYHSLHDGTLECVKTLRLRWLFCYITDGVFHVSYPCLASGRQLYLPLLIYDTEVVHHILSAVSLLVHLPFGPLQEVNGVLQAQFSLYLRSKEDYVCYCPLHCSPPYRGPYFEMRSQEPFARYPPRDCPKYQCQFLSRPPPY